VYYLLNRNKVWNLAWKDIGIERQGRDELFTKLKDASEISGHALRNNIIILLQMMDN